MRPNPNTRKSTLSLPRRQGMSMETDEAVQKVKELRAAVVHQATEEEGDALDRGGVGAGPGRVQTGALRSECGARPAGPSPVQVTIGLVGWAL
jgi:hypothetical protein